MRTTMLSAFLLVAVIGCKGGDSRFVGTWQLNQGGAFSEYHFFPDAHFTMQTHYGAELATVDGHYSLDGDRFVMEPDKGDVQGPDNQIGDQLRSTINQKSRVPLRWNNPMSFTLSMPDSGPGLTFSRVSDRP